jgi:geranylgeranyl diphosphate synthase type I
MNSKKVLARYKEDVDERLENFFIQNKNKFQASSLVSQSYDTIKEFTLRGGKRLRPALVFYTYQLFSDENLDEVKEFSLFMELVQTYLLIHDDIFDKSALRRGKPSVHKLFEEYAKDRKYSDDKHFGKVMAILCGDLACQFVYELISVSDFDEHIKTQVTEFITHKLSKVLVGQVLDFELPLKREYEIFDINQVNEYKTASYTCELPMKTGAILAERNDKETMDILSAVALNLGIAFQIRDDILGMFGTEEKLGKGTSSDIREGKRTLLIYKALDNGSEAQSSLINKLLGKPDLTDNEADKVREVIKETGALEYSQEKCEEFGNRAVENLKKLGKEGNRGFKFIKGITEFVVHRDY